MTISRFPRRAAFFDVDGTLTRTTTMFDLLRLDAEERNCTRQGEDFLRELRRMQVEDGVSRTVANRTYFRWWQGRPVEDLELLVERWIAARHSNYFHAATLSLLEQHRDVGDVVVLVSGSVPLLLQALARSLGIRVVLATQMLVRDGTFTGEIDEPMIGSRKTAAAATLAAQQQLDLTEASAYGDHLSDIALLELVGSPVMCSCPGSIEWEHALARGWQLLHIGT